MKVLLLMLVTLSDGTLVQSAGSVDWVYPTMAACYAEKLKREAMPVPEGYKVKGHCVSNLDLDT